MGLQYFRIQAGGRSQLQPDQQFQPMHLSHFRHVSWHFFLDQCLEHHGLVCIVKAEGNVSAEM